MWLLTAAIFYGVAKAVFPEEPGRNSLLRFFGRFVKLLLLTVIAVLILATFRRKSDVSSGPGLCRIDQGLARVCIGAAPGFSVPRGKFFFRGAVRGFMHSSDLPKLFLY